MKLRLSRKLTLYFTLMALVLTGLFALATSIVVRNSFEVYKYDNQVKRDQAIVETIEGCYQDKGEVTRDVIVSIYEDAIDGDYYITLYDEDKNKIWSMEKGQWQGNGQGQGHMMHGMMGGQMEGSYTEQEYTVMENGEVVGYVEVGQYQPILITEEDVNFILQLRNGLILSAVIGLFLAILTGAVLSNKLARPIVNIKNTTDVMKHGDLSVRAPLDSKVVEIDELSASINQLAGTLEDQEHLRIRLTRDISHELRTPLHVMKSHIDALVDGLWEATPDKLNILNEEIIRLNGLVEDLEKLTILGEKDDTHLDDHDLSKVVDKVVEQYKGVCREKGIALDHSLDKDIVCRLDENKIKQVLFNLLSNALKYTDEGGRIFVGLRKREGSAEIVIRDSGIGMDQEDLEHIFERFYRTDASRNRQTGGAGLGLAIVKKIIDTHKGTIEVISKEGDGTEFKIYLPLSSSS